MIDGTDVPLSRDSLWNSPREEQDGAVNVSFMDPISVFSLDEKSLDHYFPL